MWSFISHRLDSSEDLRSRLEWLEVDLVAAWKAAVEEVEALRKAEEENEAFQVEADKLRKEGEVIETKLKEAEQETSRLKKETEKL